MRFDAIFFYFILLDTFERELQNKSKNCMKGRSVMKKEKNNICRLGILLLCMTILIGCQGKQEDLDEPKQSGEEISLSGSFLQSWACREWSQERWEYEFAAMKDVGMEFLILQSVYDLEMKTESDCEQDWQAYTSGNNYSLYPTNIEELQGATLSGVNDGDVLQYALNAAKTNDMKIYIGLISDNRWWNYGWGIPELPDGKKEAATESYFATWCEYNGKLNGQMITEIWERYGEEYGEQIAGWYYYNEIWNIDVGCKRRDNQAYAVCLGNNINHMLEAINESCPEKAIMLSPFYNPKISSAVQYKNFWIDIFSVANFREGDIFAPQDCVGGKNVAIRDLDDWIGGLKEATETESGLRFWVNNECFNEDYTPADVARFIQQMEATAKYAEEHITFSWNHYYNPLHDVSYKAYNEELKSYLNGELQAE